MLLDKFIQNIQAQRLFSPSHKLLIGVSGGVDSVVLCDLCAKAGFSFGVAHANFSLRGSESDEDESFVRQLAAAYNAPLHVNRFHTESYASEQSQSIQVAARALRYAWFRELLDSSYDYILTAHHADDNIETVLMNFFRGTGISGLRGIQPSKERLVRPLLPFSKAQITTYAQQHGLSWREDSSNASEKYSRNYFRHAVIPAIKQVYPEVEQNLLSNIRRFNDIELLYHQAIAAHRKKLITVKGNETFMPVLMLKKTFPLQTVLYEIIRPFQFSSHQVNDVIRLLDAEQASFVQSSTHRIIRNRNWLIISPLHTTETAHVIIEESDRKVQFARGILELKLKKAAHHAIPTSPAVACLDSSSLVFPLVLRRWKAGDYFYPLGLGKKKKVSRFLIDQKISPTEKERVWVLESDKRICWVVGLRIDDRFKITPHTPEWLELKQVKDES